MADMGMKLTDKTVLLCGKFNLCLQNLASNLTESGANVLLLTDDPKAAQRFSQTLSDLREVSEKYGKAISFDEPFNDDQNPDHYFSKTAELFGTADIYIDLNLFNFDLPLMASPIPEKFKSEFAAQYLIFQKMTASAIKFIRTRSRGRIIALFHELDMLTCERENFSGFLDFKDFISKTAMTLAGAPHHTSFNAVAIGINEEYLLKKYPKFKTIRESLKELNKIYPSVKLVEHSDISNTTLFLASPLSTGINGQIIHCNHGAEITNAPVLGVATTSL
jgi:NAD(P)-dependent dehydrogenase (short-subunit alcohol dehydrogenase family)